MKAYFIRRPGLGRGSIRGVLSFSKTEGIEGYLNDGRRHSGTSYEKTQIPSADVVIRWGCTSNVPGNPIVLNKAAAIHEVSDKAAFRKKCADAGIAMKTFLSASDFEASPFYPAVVRPTVHSQGRKLLVANNLLEFKQAWAKYPGYVSEFIDKKKEFRVFILQGRVVWIAEKIPDNPAAVAWNVAQGGTFNNVKWGDWDLNVCKTAIAAMNLTTLDFGGVDIMVDAAGKAYVLEINSAPSQTSPYRQECVARAFDWLLKKMQDNPAAREKLPLEADFSWKCFIHPGVLEQSVKKMQKALGSEPEGVAA